MRAARPERRPRPTITSSSGIPRAAHTQSAAFHGLAARSTDLPCAHGYSASGSLQGQPSGSSECLDGWRCRDVSLLRCRGDRRVRRPVADPRGRPRLGPRRSHQLNLPASIEAALSMNSGDEFGEVITCRSRRSQTRPRRSSPGRVPRATAQASGPRHGHAVASPSRRSARSAAAPRSG